MNFRFVLAGLALITAAPAAQAQIVIQTPQIPGFNRIEPQRQDLRREPEREEYWRRRRDNEQEAQWRRREEYRDEEHKREEWQRDHCVRDWRNQEFCRR